MQLQFVFSPSLPPTLFYSFHPFSHIVDFHVNYNKYAEPGSSKTDMPNSFHPFVYLLFSSYIFHCPSLNWTREVKDTSHYFPPLDLSDIHFIHFHSLLPVKQS